MIFQFKSDGLIIVLTPVYYFTLATGISVSYSFPHKFLQQPIALILGIVLMTTAAILLFFAPRELVKIKQLFIQKEVQKLL